MAVKQPLSHNGSPLLVSGTDILNRVGAANIFEIPLSDRCPFHLDIRRKLHALQVSSVNPCKNKLTDKQRINSLGEKLGKYL